MSTAPPAARSTRCSTSGSKSCAAPMRCCRGSEIRRARSISSAAARAGKPAGRPRLAMGRGTRSAARPTSTSRWMKPAAGACAPPGRSRRAIRTCATTPRTVMPGSWSWRARSPRRCRSRWAIRTSRTMPTTCCGARCRYCSPMARRPIIPPAPRPRRTGPIGTPPTPAALPKWRGTSRRTGRSGRC